MAIKTHKNDKPLHVACSPKRTFDMQWLGTTERRIEDYVLQDSISIEKPW